MKNNNIKLEIYLEKRASRTFVGSLYREESFFIFEYNKAYIYSRTSIPLGPELPLTKRIYRSKELFLSFYDRIPSKQNPAYKEYCQKFNIDPNEVDEILLLSTIGKKGPSSFIFELHQQKEYTSYEYRIFRKELELSLRDFASIFQISISTLQKLEKGNDSVKEALKRIEIYNKFPEVAIFEIDRNKKYLHSNKYEHLLKAINKYNNYKIRSKGEQ